MGKREKSRYKLTLEKKKNQMKVTEYVLFQCSSLASVILYDNTFSADADVVVRPAEKKTPT